MGSKFMEKIVSFVVAIAILAGAYFIFRAIDLSPGKKTPEATVKTYLEGFSHGNDEQSTACFIPAIATPLAEITAVNTSSEQAFARMMASSAEVSEAWSIYRQLLPAYLKGVKLSVIEYTGTIEETSAKGRIKLGLDGEFHGSYLNFNFMKVGDEWLISRAYTD